MQTILNPQRETNECIVLTIQKLTELLELPEIIMKDEILMLEGSIPTLNFDVGLVNVLETTLPILSLPGKIIL